jgi:hypothetical protein
MQAKGPDRIQEGTRLGSLRKKGHAAAQRLPRKGVVAGKEHRSESAVSWQLRRCLETKARDAEEEQGTQGSVIPIASEFQ